MASRSSANRLHYVVAIAWILATVALASWWLSIGLTLTTRLHKMFIWEGAFFIGLLMAGGFAIVMAIRREHLRRESLETFFMSFTHDLKTSIASVQLQAEGLRANWPETAARAALDRLLHDTVRLQIQLENSLFVAQPDGRLLGERIDAGRAIERLAEDWPELTVAIAGQGEVTADARGFDAVVRNVLQNAVVHGGAHRVNVGIETHGAAGSARVSFTDDGRGVPADVFEALGRPFGAAGRTRGSGVGLFVCSQLVSRMHGALRFVRSTAPGQGLTVIVELPEAR